MNRQILRIAVPSIVSNITVPLLALADTAIVGHLGSVDYIGAVALGGMLFNMTYWLFGFLRMGTGGLTAQAYGAGRRDEAFRVLLRSLGLAACVSLLLIVLQRPLLHTAFRFITATPAVEAQARTYFSILIWGAPAVLGLYGFTGWFLGMQQARYPMYIAIVQNVVNIATSLTLVLALHMKVDGVAAGTLVAQYAGLLMALLVWRARYRHASRSYSLRGTLSRKALGEFFRVNRDIFLRTLCLIAVTTCFTSTGSAQGPVTLAANTLLMQFFILFSYIMDGFAYAGEALGGRYCGARDAARFSLLTRRLFTWGLSLAALFTLAYLAGGRLLLAALTDNAEAVAAALRYLPYAVAVPAVSFAAFLFDGLFIGTTSTRLMLCSMAVAAGLFFTCLHLLPATNHTLWAAFLVYLGSRGLVQALCFPRVRRKI